MSNAILLGVGIVDNTAKDLARISSKLRATGRNLSSVGAELTQGITFPVVAAGAALLKFSGDLDAMKKALAANMGSTAAAAREFENLRKAAEAPGIGLEEALRGSIQLQALGANADEARRMLLGLAKAVELSGGGQWEFGRVQEQFIQMVGRGRILQEDLKFMFQAAPKLRGVVNEIFGTSDPEQLRKITNVKDFVEKITAALEKLEGTGGSVKNSLENLWTSMRVGAGEIGLAILGVGNFGKNLEGLPKALDKVVASIVNFIHNNKELVSTLIKVALAMAAIGPIARAIGNIKIIGSMFLSIASGAKGAYEWIVKYNAAAKTTGGLSIGAAGGIAAVALAFNEIVAKPAVSGMHDFNEQLNKTAQTFDRWGLDDRVRNLAQAFAEFQTLQFGKSWESIKHVFGDGKTALPGRVGRGSMGGAKWAANFGGSSSDEKSIWAGFDPAAADTPKTDPYKFNPDNSWKDDPAMASGFSGLISAANEGKKAYTSAIKEMQSANDEFNLSLLATVNEGKTMMDFYEGQREALSSYADSLKRISIEQGVGLSMQDALKQKIDATRTAYMAIAEQYGATSEQATKLKDSLTLLTEEQDKQLMQQQKHAALMEYLSTAVNGLVDSISELVTSGKSGLENFGKSILKVVGQMLKMVLTQLILKAVSQLPFFAAPAGIAAASGFFGTAVAAIKGVPALAEGGLMTGESIVRAGEYPGVKADPEVISPVSKIQKYIREAVGGGSMHAIIRGDDIHLVTSKAQSRKQRIGSGNVINF